MNQKHYIIQSGLLLIWLITVIACVTPVTPKLSLEDSKPMLVVEGQVTDQVGPFRVKLTSTSAVNETGAPPPVLNAIVNIIDDQGRQYQLYGNDKGVYETAEKNLKGLVGNKYTLTITTPEDGREYTSPPVLMEKVPAIDSVYYKEVKHIRISEGVAFEDTWLNILLDTHDPEGNTKYWRYDYEETWKVDLTANPVKVNHSLQYPENYDWERVLPIDDKKICWLTKSSSSIVVANTEKNPVDELNGFIVQAIGPNDTRLNIRYSILIRQYALDAELYNYWNRLKDINENSGGLYNRMPAPVYGNITCCDGAGKALGYFGASSVSEKRIFINRSDHHLETVNLNYGCTYFSYSVPPTQQKILFGMDVLMRGPVYTSSPGCADCTLFGTNIKPSFWY